MCPLHSLLVEKLWKWCVSHMLNKVVQEEFGVALIPTKSRKPEARELIQGLRNIIEHLNKFTKGNAHF